MKSDPQQPVDLNSDRLPAHLAVIMDGNGRWAKKRMLNRIKGHEQGSETVRTVVTTCRELGIPYLTLYAFSTENWERPKSEVNALMALLKKFIIAEKEKLLEKGIRLNVIGQRRRLPEDVQSQISDAMALTGDCTGMVLNLALSYGGREEMASAVRKIARQIESGRLASKDIDSRLIGAHLYTAGMPDPDLLIRTSGEHRISNFLLWQIAYTELFITQTLWPDFSKQELFDILKNYQQRDRRFGKV